MLYLRGRASVSSEEMAESSDFAQANAGRACSSLEEILESLNGLKLTRTVEIPYFS